MTSPQTLTPAERRVLALWAADCAERVIGLVERAAPEESRPRDAIERARAFGRGELDAAGQIRHRFVAGRAAEGVHDPAAIAAIRSAAQAASVAHMGAHALGAAGYAVTAVGSEQAEEETAWQLQRLAPEQQAALLRLPLLGTDRSGPLGPGLLTSGTVGDAVRRLQAGIRLEAVSGGAER